MRQAPKGRDWGINFESHVHEPNSGKLNLLHLASIEEELILQWNTQEVENEDKND